MAYDTESALRWIDEDLYDEYKKEEIRNSVPSLETRKRFNASDMNTDDARKLMSGALNKKVEVAKFSPRPKQQVPHFSPIPVNKPTAAPSVDNLPPLPEEKKASIADMMKAAYDSKKEAIQKQRSTDLQLARYHAMSDVFNNLLKPVAWRFGGQGTDFTTAPKVEDKGYIEAFNRARQASDKLINLDTEYQNDLTNYQINQARINEQRAYQQQQEQAERAWREEQAQKEHEHRASLAQAEQEARKELAETQHKNTMAEIEQRYKYPQRYETNEPSKEDDTANYYTSNGDSITFDSQKDLAAFYQFAEKIAGDELYNGIDGTMDEKTEANIKKRNLEKFIDKDPKGLYDAWKSGKGYKKTSPVVKQSTSPFSLGGDSILFQPVDNTRQPISLDPTGGVVDYGFIN